MRVNLSNIKLHVIGGLAFFLQKIRQPKRRGVPFTQIVLGERAKTGSTDTSNSMAERRAYLPAAISYWYGLNRHGTSLFKTFCSTCYFISLFLVTK